MNPLASTGFIKYIFSRQSTLRLAISIASGIGIATILLYLSYITYWQKTIYRIQTVDFNILANTLPSKLSSELINNNNLEIQRILDSNYGLFGLIVTDCKTMSNVCNNQRIRFVSKGTVKYRSTRNFTVEPTSVYAKNWQSSLPKQDLSKELFLVLRDPAPATSEIEYKSARDDNPTKTGRTNAGSIIGRVYLLRNPTPPFLSAIVQWLSNPTSSSSNTIVSNGIALSTFLTSLIVWLLCEILVYKNKLITDKAIDFEQNLLIAEFEKVKAEEEHKQSLLVAEIERIKAQDEALRLKSFWDGFQENFDQDFSSVLANKLEELYGLFRRLDVDIDNIVHDFRKAPLLVSSDDLSNGKMINNLKNLLPEINNVKASKVIEEVTEFIENVGETVSSINWVINDLRQVANIDPEKINIKDVILKFLNNMPPSSKQNWLKVNFHDSDEPIYIHSNDWHIRSMLKNIIYNSTAALTDIKMECFCNQLDFEGVINISCYSSQGKAFIQIDDNGKGFPEAYLKVLYQSNEPVNGESNNRGRGSVIVNSYLKLHHGQVELSNLENGSGARVIFRFPLADLESLPHIHQLQSV